MYKLFLCLRYLRSRIIAYFAVAAVTLCVAMLVIVVSVMNGFLDKIEDAAKGLFGDIVVSASDSWGIARYDAFIAQLRREVPEVEAVGPFIDTYAFLRLPGVDDYREPVRVAGIRLPQRAAVSNFAEGLFVQGGREAPTWDPDVEAMIEAVRGHIDYIKAVRKRVEEQGDGEAPSADRQDLLDRLDNSIGWMSQALVRLEGAATAQSPMRYLEELCEAIAGVRRGEAPAPRTVGSLTDRLQAYQESLDWADLANRYRRRIGGKTDELERARRLGREDQASLIELELMELRGLPERIEGIPQQAAAAVAFLAEAPSPDPSSDSAREHLEQVEFQLGLLVDLSGVRPPADRVILGLGLPGLSNRTQRGERYRLYGPGMNVVLQVLPLGRVSATDYSTNDRELTVVDDSKTGVYSIDNTYVYLPFETVQQLNNMTQPSRCSQIHIKVKDAYSGRRELERVARAVQACWVRFRKANPGVCRSEVTARTWRQMQAGVVEPIESQRTLAVVMFGIISVVAVFLIYVIFYMIVNQKTRDIGVLKSVGASSGGVAAIFLGYGMVIGLVGSILGTLLGWYFVVHINPIHDWVGEVVGIRVWRMETFLFEEIPNQVDWGATLVIAIGSIVAGLLGALHPAIVAATRQPVNALRYE